MLRRIFYILLFIFAFSSISSARISTEQEIKEIAKGLKQKGGGQFDCYVRGRYIVFEFYLLDNSLISKFTKEYIVDQAENQLAVLCSTNFIGVKYTYHYIDNAGVERTRNLTIEPLEFLNMSGNNREIVSLKDHPKASGVNIELTKPKGWEVKEGNGPHIVQKYEANMVHYYIQINELPTFFSRKEAELLFSDNPTLGLSLDDFLSEYFSGYPGCNIHSREVEMVNRYPALHVRFDHTTTRMGVTLPTYANVWIIFYEDKLITIWGSTISTDEKEQSMYDVLFSMLVNNVRFPDQFNF